MANPRRTVHVDSLKTLANEILADEDEGSPEFREGVARLLENALVACGQYAGFEYVGQARDEEGRIVIPDETRRAYH